MSEKISSDSEQTSSKYREILSLSRRVNVVIEEALVHDSRTIISNEGTCVHDIL